MFAHAQGCTCRPAKYVGRVGALAVALGVGTAILGFAGVAAADGEAGTSGRSAGEGSTRAEDSGRATAARSGGRRDVPAPAAASDDDGSNARTAVAGQRAVNPRASADTRDSQTREAPQPQRLGEIGAEVVGPWKPLVAHQQPGSIHQVIVRRHLGSKQAIHHIPIDGIEGVTLVGVAGVHGRAARGPQPAGKAAP